MDTIEKGIQNIDAHTKKSIEKHKDILAKAIYETAEKSNKSSHSFDKNCKKVFTDSDNIGENTENFNPHTVVEFRDGKSHQVIEKWDKDVGILPNRKVMGTYYVDVGNVNELKQNEYYCKTHKTYVTLKCVNGSCNSTNMSCNHSPSCQRFSCNCTYHSNCNNIYRDRYNLNIDSKSIKRGEDRSYYHHTTTQSFEVDNYLNLYHKDSGLYLMFHKTSFPNICFYLAQEYTQLPDKTYYQIFLSKRLERLDLEMTKAKYRSIDNREKMLIDINQLVPETYHRVYQLFNNFRRFQSFELDTTIELDLDKPTENIDQLDSRDRLIEGQKTKLNETIKRCQNAEQIVADMVTKFNEKSTNIQHLEREKHLLEIELKEMELDSNNTFKAKEFDINNKLKEMELYIENLKILNYEEITKISEEKDRESFSLYQRLNEAEAFRAKSESLGISLTSLQKELEISQLDKQKMKDINIGITTQIKNEKERNTKIMNDNEDLITQIGSYQSKMEISEIRQKELNSELGTKINECYELHNKISLIGNNSSNALENALSVQVDDLQSEIEQLRAANKENMLENKNMKNKYDNLVKKLSFLMKLDDH